MNSFDPLAINPVSGTPGVVTFAGATEYRSAPSPPTGITWVPVWDSLTACRAKTKPSSAAARASSMAPLSATPSATWLHWDFPPAAQFTWWRKPTFKRIPPPRRLPRGNATAARRRASGPCLRPETPIPRSSYFNPHQVAPISYQYNLNVQREIAQDLLLEAGYIGNVSHHLTANDLTI